MPSRRVIPIGFGNIEFIWILAGDPEPITAGLGFVVENPPFTQTNAEAIAADFGSMWGTTGPNAYTAFGVEIQVSIDGPDPLVFSASDPTIGGTAAGPLPQNCTFLLDKNSIFGGRRNRGRMYVPGPPENDVSPTGTLGPGALVTGTQIADFFAGLPLSLTHNTNPLVIFHSYSWPSGPDPGPPPGFPAPTPIVGIECDPIIATQRRRLR